MALYPDFPDSPHAILALEIRWFPADEALEAVIYFYDVAGAKNKVDLMRFDSSGTRIRGRI